MLTSNSKDDVQAVKMWLRENGVAEERVKLSQSMNWLITNVTVREAERLLKTEYFLFEHTMSRTPQIACHQYHLPPHIAKLVDFITPTVHFDAKVPMHDRYKHGQVSSQHELRKRQSRHDFKENVAFMNNHKGSMVPVRAGNAATVGMSLASLPKQGAQLADADVTGQLEMCDRQITPDCLRALYQFEPGTSANAGNSFGIVEYSPQSYLPGDLDKFFSNFSSKLKGQRPKLESIDGGVLINSNQSFTTNGEADLDLQVAMALVAPQTVTLYQVGDLVEGASFNNFLDAIDGSYCTFEGGDDHSQDAIYPDPENGYIGPANCGGYAATKVISTSYGYNEADLTPFYQNRQCMEYMKLALQGVTVLYSSGDYGVAGNLGRCIDPTTGNYTRTNASSGIFNPSFPSTCPWVTSVGATQVANGTNIVQQLATNTQPEQACETVIRSGGGFSNNFAMPDYQSSAVHSWWTNHAPPYGSDRFNNSQKTRGYPDISANGANYVIAVDGNYTLVYGTSASAPSFGSIITLINEQRLTKGKKAVGFLNQVLYNHPEMMRDVTKGTNSGCGTSGFQAVSGWDPCKLSFPSFFLGFGIGSARESVLTFAQ
jgi:tripeptidyl-peptidase I